MLFKVIAISLFILHCAFLQAEENIQASSTIIKEDLGDLYAVAFNNKWKTITERMESIIINYEKHKNNEEALKQLFVLKEFVQTSKLNSIKSEAFFKSYETIVEHLKNTRETRWRSFPVVRQNKPVEIVTPKFQKLIKTEEDWFNDWMWFALAGLIGGGMVFFLKNKMSNSQKKSKLYFEQHLKRESDLNCWASIKPEIYHLMFESCTLTTENAAYFVMEDLFSLEFNLFGQTLPAKSVARLKKILSERQGELLLVTDYKAEGAIQTRKLVLNFPYEGCS